MEPVLMDTAPVHLATVEAFVKHVSSVCCWCSGRSCTLTTLAFLLFFLQCWKSVDQHQTELFATTMDLV